MVSLTLTVEKTKVGFVGQIKELPEVLTQGASIEEVKENIIDALELYLEFQREQNTTISKNIVYQQPLAVA